VVSAVLAGARHGGGRLFEAVDGDAAREGQSNQGDGDQLAHGGDSDEGITPAIAPSETASQNSFSIPASQKVAEPRVLSGAEIVNSAPRLGR